MTSEEECLRQVADRPYRGSMLSMRAAEEAVEKEGRKKRIARLQSEVEDLEKIRDLAAERGVRHEIARAQMRVDDRSLLLQAARDDIHPPLSAEQCLRQVCDKVATCGT